jgi:chorismate lyase/3-hydroxybenzoate synthase
VSGTASIVGCESVHVGNVELQMRETMENLRVVCEVASDGRYRLLEELPGAVYRAYVRHPDHYAAIRAMFDDVVGPVAKSTWVRGDICREELLLEIELWSRL